MPVPLLVIAAAAVGSVAVSVTSGYILERTIGDGEYSGRDAAVDIGLGLIPGAALVKPGVKIAASARHLRHFDRSEHTVKGFAAALAWMNRHNFKQLGIYGATTVAAGGVYDHLSNSGGSSTGGVTRPQQKRKGGLGSSTKQPTVGKSSSRALRTGTTRTRSKRWCPRHRKYD